MKLAVEAVVFGHMSLSRAAETYNIPKSTLYDHKKGKSFPGVKSGHPTLLSEEEEEDLVSFLIECSEIGYPKTRLEVIAIAERMIRVKGKEEQCPKLSSGWWQSFARRHQELSLKAATCLSKARAQASDPESLMKYASLLEETIEKYGLVNDPALIFNIDESGFPLDPKPLKSVFKRGEKNPCSITAGNKSQMTIVACVSAAGQCVPPMVVFARKTMNPALAHGEVPGSVYGLSDNGWMTQYIFGKWFKRHFLRYAPAARPLLLLMDGHSSHYCPETIKLAMEEDVILFTLPPNTTHITQPLDKGIFGSLKMKWRQIVHDYRVSHPGQVVTQYNFCRLFSKAWVESMTPVNVCSGFKTTGKYPLDPGAMKIPCQEKESESKFIEDVSKVPYTPAKRRVVFDSEDDDDDGQCQIPDSPLISVSKYKELERHSTVIKMTNIDDLPSPVFKKKAAKVERDLCGKVLTSQECLHSIEKKKKEKELRQSKGRKKREYQRVGMIEFICAMAYGGGGWGGGGISFRK